MVSLTPVTFHAQHLAVLLYGRGDVVAFHEFEIKLLMAMGADMMLLLPHLHLDVIGETAQL